MALGKQAKVLSRAQIDGALGYIAKTRHPDPQSGHIPSVSEGGSSREGNRVADVGHAHGRRRSRSVERSTCRTTQARDDPAGSSR